MARAVHVVAIPLASPKENMNNFLLCPLIPEKARRLTKMKDTCESRAPEDELAKKLARTTALLNSLIDLLEVRKIITRADLLAALDNYNSCLDASVSCRIKELTTMLDET